MKELEIELHTEGGTISWNYEEIKKQIADSQLEYIECKNGQSAYFLRNKLNEYQTYYQQIESIKEHAYNEYMQSVQSFTDQAEYLCETIKEQQLKIESCLDGYYEESRKEKEELILSYFMSKMSGYGILAQKILESDWFFEEEWTSKKISNRKLYQALDEKISQIILDLEEIKRNAVGFETVMLHYYVQCHNMRKVWMYYEELTTMQESLKEETVSEQCVKEAIADYPDGTMEYKAEGNSCQMEELEEYANFIGMKIKRTKNNMPKGIHRHELPDFSSFVALDLETSGSLGLVRGDTPAEIIEIGAVRYENGKLTDTFSMLVNPGRHIVETVSKLTGITDEMVKDQAAPEEAVVAFAQFAGDSILLGHDLKNADIPFLERVARKCGIHFENEYFDTYEYAQKLKEKEQFEKLRLGELAKHYNLEIDHLHRAKDDAELTARLYFAMREHDH